MKTNQKITFRLTGIKELNYQYFVPTQYVTTGLKGDKVESSYNINYGWNIENDLFAVILTISYDIRTEEDSEKSEKINCLKLTVMVEFHVENLQDLATFRSDNDFEISETLEITLVSITLSTVRGILFEKVKGTLFNNLILPIINPAEAILSKKLKEEEKKKG